MAIKPANSLAIPPTALIQTLAARTEGTAPGPEAMTAKIPVTRYTSSRHLENERSTLFQARPIIIGHQTQIPEPGDTLAYDWLGLPLVTMRDKTGAIGTFMNVCRHRGMRLVQNEGFQQLKSLVCPYHNWTYGLDGELRNIPRDESFENLDAGQHNLVAIQTVVRNGLIWIQLEGSLNIDQHLAGLGEDLETFDMSALHFSQQHVRTIDCNWKLVQDAFLDGYHVTRLHKNTVGPFFPDAVAESDNLGDHIRSAVARNEITEAISQPAETLNLRRVATFSYTVFPNAVLIFHPEYTSIISLFPLSPDKTIFAHTMLTPAPPKSDEERDHFLRSFELIDGGVFQAEDIFVSEGAQRGMKSGANTHLTFGGLEESAVRFHKIIERELAEK
ncbi:MAG: aromatic ring-hydroxylating dioxygenase subunit alpha [Halioglobus sp.]